MLNKKTFTAALSGLAVIGTLGVATVGAQQQNATTNNLPEDFSWKKSGIERKGARLGGTVSNLTNGQFSLTVGKDSNQKEITVSYSENTKIVKKPAGNQNSEENTQLSNGQFVLIQGGPKDQNDKSNIEAKRILVINKEELKENITSGEIQSLTKDTVVIKDAEGNNITVNYNADTTINIFQQNKGNFDLDLIGKPARVVGEKQSDGSIQAQRIAVGKKPMGNKMPGNRLGQRKDFQLNSEIDGSAEL